jgi:hypothetical protein
MARINIKEMKRKQSRNIVHQSVQSNYKIFKKGDTKYIQIDTYGTTHRQDLGKISQSIQFDKESAVKLIEILEKEFNKS